MAAVSALAPSAARTRSEGGNQGNLLSERSEFGDFLPPQRSVSRWWFSLDLWVLLDQAKRTESTPAERADLAGSFNSAIMMKRNAYRTQLRFLALLGLLLLGGCSWEYNGKPDPDPPPQTKILSVRMQPDTVMAGDTMLVHCVIRDSLDDRFVFDWAISPENLLPVNGTLTGPKIRWVAPIPSRSGVSVYLGGVGVDNGSQDSTRVSEGFTLPVMKPAATP